MHGNKLRYMLLVCASVLCASSLVAQAPDSAALATYVSQRVDAIRTQLAAGSITADFAGGELDDQITVLQAGQFAFGADFTALGAAGTTLNSALGSAQQLIAAARASLGAPGSATLIDTRLKTAKGALDVVAAGLTAGNITSLTAAQQATLASLSVGPAAAVSAASYAAPVAPGSIATVFASALATSAASGTFDAKGNLPTVLGGVSIEVGGQRVGILAVSATQASFIVPNSVSVGPNDLLVTTDAGQVYKGTVNVANVAPAIFSVAQNGAGEGVIVNGITGARGPFAVTTSTNPGTDKRTRLTIYATGIRNASGLPGSVQVTIGGMAVTTEFAGAHPTFAGLDQVNVIVPAELANQGVLNVQMQVGGAASNTVTAAFAEAGALIFRLSAMKSSEGDDPEATLTYVANPAGFPGDATVEANGLTPSSRFALYNGKDHLLGWFASDANGHASAKFLASQDDVNMSSTLTLRSGDAPVMQTTREIKFKSGETKQ